MGNPQDLTPIAAYQRKDSGSPDPALTMSLAGLVSRINPVEVDCRSSAGYYRVPILLGMRGFSEVQPSRLQ